MAKKATEKKKSSLEERYKEALKHEADLAFLLPGKETKWERAVKARNSAFSGLFNSFDDMDNKNNKKDMSKEDIKVLGSAWHFLNQGLLDQPGGFYLPKPSQALCAAFEKHQADIIYRYRNDLLGVQENVLKPDRLIHYRHKVQRHALDQVLSRLKNLRQFTDKKKDDFGDKLTLMLAKAHFYRGSIIRPKGFSVPAKKREALSNALKFSDDLLEILKNSSNDSLKKEALMLKANICLELESIGEKYPDMATILTEAVLHCVNGKVAKDQVDVILRQAELNKKNNSYVKEVLDNDKITSLARARAALLLNKNDDALYFALKAVDEVCYLPFLHPDWEELRRLVLRLAGNHTQGWKDIALKAWKACVAKELMTYHNCHIRWYWSMQRDFYDMAFHATDSLQKKAEVADSLKGRPALHWQTLERMDKKQFAERIRQEEAGRLGRYVKSLHGNKPKGAGTRKNAGSVHTELVALPMPWIVVHFYMSSIDEKGKKKAQGWALINDSKKIEDSVWEIREFDPAPIWNTFWTWQENYQQEKIKAAADLDRLCFAMGEEMPFLFEEELFPENRPVVFVPYDFLQRLPLHMAMKKGGGNEKGVRIIWAKAHPTTYLPAWSLWNRHGIKADGEKIVMMHLKQEEAEDHTDNLYQNNHTRHPEWDQLFDSATGKKLLSISIPPSILILLCHGKANMANPFGSCLELDGKSPSHSDILANKLNLDGTRVYQGACETDLSPPIRIPADEHLSLSSALLHSGAAEVVGGLWEVRGSITDELLKTIRNDIKDGKPTCFYKLLWEWQKQRIKDYVTNNYGAKSLYDIAPFRCLGLPVLGSNSSADRSKEDE